MKLYIYYRRDWEHDKEGRAEVSDMQIKNVLVVGAHPDDESFSAGRIMVKLHKKGVKIHVANISNGDMGAEEEHMEDKIAQVRAE